MPNQQQPEGDREPRRRRMVRYRAMIKLRMEREEFLRVFSAAKLMGASSASHWMRRVLREAAARDIEQHAGRHHRPLGGG